ncbi:MAG: class I SAM-dependent methyltransferase [Myxococcota bacterium]
MGERARPESMFAPELFARDDESADALFYREPRFALHVDEATIAALTQLYREELPPGCRLLDLMSSWVSHLPSEIRFAHVAGLGMNQAELAANPRLDERRVQDLNRDPVLPWQDASFDAVLCAVSVQYLVRPVEVFAEVARVLRDGGKLLVATSHRLFATKAIAAWRALPAPDRLRLVGRYLEQAGGFGKARVIDRSPAGADPLWVVTAERAPR